MDVRLIDTSHIVSILSPIWATKTETAKRLRGRIEQVLNWATVSEHREGLNPARWRGHLDVLMGKTTVKPVHMKSVPYSAIGALIPRLISAEGMGVLALRFAILCASRSGEVRGMRWSEVNLTTGVWTIPAERMKAKREHLVPLSTQAIELLRSLPTTSGSELVFWGQSGKALSDMTLSAVLRRLDVDATVHGFRSTFRMWAAERTNFPREVAEAALAHVNAVRVEAAYQRGSFLPKRKDLMQAWADFCDQPVAATDGGAQVISIRAAA
jgi:integrase